jgi:hypothetical protein
MNWPRSAARLTVLLMVVVLTTSCSLFESPEKKEPAPRPAVADAPFGSEFTRDGTFQSHTMYDGVDFVYTVWAAKATPRMQEWHPQGDKFFSFTFQGYDTRRRMRDPFRTKRLVWLERMKVTSQTTTKSGATESPYSIDEWAPDVTFDPEARTNGRKGMLITSPKGAFELRNQAIRSLADDTEGVTLTFRFIVHIERRAGSGRYVRREVVQTVPIAIFESEYATRPQPVPYNAS